jgi:hypothetical protein
MMPTTHVRCSEQVHKKLKEIAAQEGVTLAQALEILASTSPPDGSTSDPVQEEDFLSYLGFPKADGSTEKEVDPLTTKLDTINSQLESLGQMFNQFDETLRLNIASAVSQSFEQQASLAKLKEKAPAEEDHADQHVHDGKCQECNTVAKACYEKGMSEPLKIPGAQEAINFFYEQQKRNAECAEEPVVENWSEVPGVKELIQKYQDAKSLITFVDSGPQQRNSDQQVIQTILAMLGK